MIRVEHLFISLQHNYFGHHGRPPGESGIVSVNAIECVAGSGIRGDRFFNYKPGYKGQITFFSMEVFDELRHQFHLEDARPEYTRRNVFTSGFELNSLIGKEFQIQGVGFAGTEECRPCYWMNTAFRNTRVEAWLQGRGGLRARILSDGVLQRDPPVP